MREKEIERWLGKAVRAAGGMYFKFVSPGNAGVPDRIIVLPGGRIRFVELKAEDGQASPIQRRMVEKLTALGCDARIVKGLAEVEAYMKEVVDC